MLNDSKMENWTEKKAVSVVDECESGKMGEVWKFWLNKPSLIYSLLEFEQFQESVFQNCAMYS